MKLQLRSIFYSTAAFLMVAGGFLAVGCTQNTSVGKEKDSNYNQKLVINELMTHNEATVISGGKTSSWIEIKNISDGTITLKEYSLIAEKAENKAPTDSTTTQQKDSTATPQNDSTTTLKGKKKDKKKAEKDSLTTDRWFFPECEIEAGGKVLVYVGNDSLKNGQMVANIKMPSKNGHLMLLSPKGTILADADYPQLDTDQSLARQEDGSMTVCDIPTPGFDNTDEGLEAYMAQWEEERKDGLKIWEIKANGAALTEQWIELKNTSTAAINLKEYALSNKASNPTRYQLPDVSLAPGAFYAVKTVGKTNAKIRTNVADFKLGDNDAALLSHNGKIVDAMSARGCIMGSSRGRIDGKKGMFYFASPTLGAENSSKGCRMVAPNPTTDKKPGIYPDQQTMTVTINDHGHKVHYTLDGTEPTSASPLYTKPLQLTKTTTIRYYAEGDEQTMRSAVMTDTYMLGMKQPLAVVQVTIRKEDLYDPMTGIYVEGNRSPNVVQVGNHSENRNANYLQRWAKKAHVEFFDGKEGFEADCALKIFGAGSRHLPKKSFSLKFDSEFGPSTVTYDFFNNGTPVEMEDIVLRSGTTDNRGVMIRDEFFTSLMAPECPTLLTQAYRPVALYLNDEYYGIYFFREKIGKDFISRHLGVSKSNIQMLRSQKAEIGTTAEFDSITRYARNNDMSTQEAYDFMNKRIDFLSLIDQKLGQFYSGNTDIYNVRQVKSSDADSDQKWYWALYDLDNSWTSQKPAAFYLRSSYNQGIGSQPVSYNNAIIDRMLANKQFRQLFLERLSHHMHHTFKPDHVKAHFDSMIKEIEPEMKRNCDRWKLMTYESWQRNIVNFKAKFDDRWKIVLDDLKTELNVTEEENAKYFGDL